MMGYKIEGGGNAGEGKQSLQSAPRSHSHHCVGSVPSSHLPLLARAQLLMHGGDGGGCRRTGGGGSDCGEGGGNGEGGG